MTRVGVVGQVEWVEFARVARVPEQGETIHASESFAEAAGGGAVTAVELARLAGEALLITAVGSDTYGARAALMLRDHRGVTVHAADRAAPHKRTFAFLDDNGERTMAALVGERIVPHLADPLPWDDLGQLDAVYFAGGDVGAARAARAAAILVATPRAIDALSGAGILVDVLVGSATDPGEVYKWGTLDPAPRAIVMTRGAQGGEWVVGNAEPRGTGDAEPVRWIPDGVRRGTWNAAPLPGLRVDSYGCGDSFAAGLTFGLGAGMMLAAAIELAAGCGAACLTRRGPYRRSSLPTRVAR